MRMTSILLALATVAALGTTAAQATPINYVSNGGFESTSGGSGKLSTSAGDTTLSNWTVTGYSYLFNAGNVDTTGSGSNKLTLWGPNDGSANGLGASQDGGNFVGADGNYYAGTLSQTLTGLTIGQTYNLTFDWAGAQQAGFTGTNSAMFWSTVFGGVTQNTASISLDSKGFSGWMQQTFQITATSTSQALTFLANANVKGAPPFLLLDGVSVTAVPEPGTWALMLGGLGAIAWLARRRRNSTQA